MWRERTRPTPPAALAVNSSARAMSRQETRLPRPDISSSPLVVSSARRPAEPKAVGRRQLVEGQELEQGLPPGSAGSASTGLGGEEAPGDQLLAGRGRVRLQVDDLLGRHQAQT